MSMYNEDSQFNAMNKQIAKLQAEVEQLTRSTGETMAKHKALPTIPGKYIARQLNVNTSTEAQFLELLCRVVSDTELVSELTFHKAMHPKHNVLIIEVH